MLFDYAPVPGLLRLKILPFSKSGDLIFNRAPIQSRQRG
jgi:hypothetical protein